MINTIFLEGNLTKDPDGQFLQTGTCRTKFRMAHNYYTKAGTKTVYLNVICWDKVAETVLENLTKGSRVIIEGQLNDDSYKDDQGVEHNQMVLKAFRVHFQGKAKAKDAPAAGQEGVDEIPPDDAPEAPAEQQEPPVQEGFGL